MNLSDLSIFSAVVSEGGITRAAEKLHRVQSGVTTRIRHLEQDLGIDLFVREGKKLHLTPAGQILLGYAGRLLALADEARVAVQDTAPCGRFRLGAMESTAAVRLPAVLSEFSRRFPDVELELRTGNPDQLAAELLAGTVEAAFFAEPVAEKRFEAVPAFREEVVIVTAGDRPFADDPDASPGTVLVFEAGCPHRRALMDWYESRGEIPERVVELGSYHAMFGCVLAGMGAALVPKSVIGSFPESDRLRVHDLPRGRRHLTTHLVWRRGMQSAKVRGLANILAGSENRAIAGV